MDIRRAVGATVGIPREKLDDLLHHRESDRFTAREQAALEYAERITRDDQPTASSSAAYQKIVSCSARVMAQVSCRGVSELPQARARKGRCRIGSRKFASSLLGSFVLMTRQFRAHTRKALAHDP